MKGKGKLKTRQRKKRRGKIEKNSWLEREIKKKKD